MDIYFCLPCTPRGYMYQPFHPPYTPQAYAIPALIPQPELALVQVSPPAVHKPSSAHHHTLEVSDRSTVWPAVGH